LHAENVALYKPSRFRHRSRGYLENLRAILADIHAVKQISGVEPGPINRQRNRVPHLPRLTSSAARTAAKRPDSAAGEDARKIAHVASKLPARHNSNFS
jgi:hypothetical protein